MKVSVNIIRELNDTNFHRFMKDMTKGLDIPSGVFDDLKENKEAACRSEAHGIEIYFSILPENQPI